MVLIDEEGEYIHGTLPGYGSSHLRKKFVEGKVYIIKNFEVVANKDQYRVVSDSKIMIKLQFDTFVKVIQEDTIIPKHRFDFLEFHNLDHRRNKFSILTDLYGVFVAEHGEPNDLKIEIADHCGNKVRVKLWGNCVTNYMEQKRQVVDGHAIIIIITSLLVKDYNGYLSLSTSPSSKLYINLDINEVNQLKTILSDKYGGAIDGKVGIQNQMSPRTNIQSILDHWKSKYDQDSIVDCLATVTGINSKSPWYYSSCIDCNCKPLERDTDFWCFRCKKAIENQTIRYRIELCVQDGDATTIFTVLDSQARKVIGQDAPSLYDSHTSEVDDDDENYSPNPELLKTVFVKKEFLFTVKINDYNHDPTKRQTFTVMKIIDKTAIEVNEASPSTQDSTTKCKRNQANIHDLNLESNESCSRTTKKVKG